MFVCRIDKHADKQTNTQPGTGPGFGTGRGSGTGNRAPLPPYVLALDRRRGSCPGFTDKNESTENRRYRLELIKMGADKRPPRYRVRLVRTQSTWKNGGAGQANKKTQRPPRSRIGCTGQHRRTGPAAGARNPVGTKESARQDPPAGAIRWYRVLLLSGHGNGNRRDRLPLISGQVQNLAPQLLPI